MRCSILTTTLMFLATFTTSASAQIKLPVFDESNAKNQDVSFEDACDGNYHHGTLVRITRNDDAKKPIEGVVVRTDSKKALLYVRTAPGAPPRAFAVSDIRRIEKGVIRRVGSTGDAATPEIHRLVILNGTKKTVSYSAPTLSSGELEQLRDLEAAENDLARVEDMSRLEERAWATTLTAQAKEKETREMANEFLWQYLARRRNNPDLPFTDTQTEVVPGPNATYWGYGYGRTVVVDRRADDAVLGAIISFVQSPPALAAKAPAPNGATAAAQRRYLAAQSRAVYENGRLVAVVVDESATQDRR
jgi:hypothetical protein